MLVCLAPYDFEQHLIFSVNSLRHANMGAHSVILKLFDIREKGLEYITVKLGHHRIFDSLFQ